LDLAANSRFVGHSEAMVVGETYWAVSNTRVFPKTRATKKPGPTRQK